MFNDVLVILTQIMSVTDRQTDRETEGRTDRHNGRYTNAQ